MAGQSDARNPYRARISRECWDEGRAARASGKPNECPHDDAHKAVLRAWGKGWVSKDEELRAEIEARRPAVTHRPVHNVRTSGVKPWPPGNDRPTFYRKPVPVPCSHCDAHYLASGSQAVKVVALGDSIGTFECRSCLKRFKLPVKR